MAYVNMQKISFSLRSLARTLRHPPATPSYNMLGSHWTVRTTTKQGLGGRCAQDGATLASGSGVFRLAMAAVVSQMVPGGACVSLVTQREHCASHK